MLELVPGPGVGDGGRGRGQGQRGLGGEGRGPAHRPSRLWVGRRAKETLSEG